MFQVEGLTFEEVEGELAAFEEIFHDAVRRVMEDVAAELGHVTVAAAEPGEPAVSMDTLGLIATLWITQVQGEPEGGGEEEGNGSLGAALHAVFRRAVNRIRRALLPYKAQVAPVIPQVPRHPSAGPSPSVEVDVPSIPDEDSDALDAIPDLPEDLAEHYLSRARNRMVRFSDDLWHEARAQLLEGFQEGESIEELRDRLVNVVGLTEKRATVVARTEIISASSAGSLAMVQYADFTGTKTWLATEDDRTRPTHREAEGQTVPLEEHFSVGGSSLQFPGDPSGQPEEIIMCRCALLYSLDDEPPTESTPVTASSHDERSIPMADSTPDVVTADGLMPEEDMCPGMNWEATLVVEDTPTGDGRMFAADALSWGELPVSLLWQRETAEGHAGSVIVGNIQSIERDGNRLVGRGTFDVEGENGREALRMVAQQFLRGVSVDVDSITQSDIEFVYPPDDNPDNNEMLLAPELMIFHKARIRAATLCAIPAFVEASIRLIEPAPMDEEMPMEEGYALTAAAVPSHSTATSDAAWDAGAQVKNLPSPLTLVTAKKMFAWYDADAVEDGEISKTACKFPHHEVSADGTPGAANLKACAAGIGALHGARTPTTIPESDRRGVYNHLAAHMRDGGMTPPEFSAELVTATGGIITSEESFVVGENGPESFVPQAMRMSKEEMDAVRPLQAAAYVLTIPDVPPAWWFTEPTDVDMHGALTVTDEGRVYGYLAPAGVAHRSFERRVTVPMGNVDYSRFMGRETFVEGGGRVISGALTMDCGHASTGYSDSDRAMDHYDNACSIVATVAIGERAGKGVWVAGAVVPGITANQISRMMACQLSGDWRPHKEKNGWREFAGALLVPVPGFAMGRSQASVRMEDGELVASAVPVRYAETPHDCGCTAVQEELSAETPGEVIDLSGVASFIARSIGRDVITRQRELASLVHGQEM